MNRTKFLFFVKGITAFLFILFSNNILANSFTAVKDGDFNTPSTWDFDPTGAAIDDNYTIPGGKIINVSSNVNVGNLTLLSGSILKVTGNNITINIAYDLVISGTNSSILSSIDFGGNNVKLTVGGNLIGGTFAKITQHPDNGYIQQLILKGASNTLYQYSFSGLGTSIVTYSGADQSVFNAGPYSNLELLESGTKTLLNASGTAGEARVTNALAIKSCKLKLGTLNFNYSGNESNLKYTDGWIYTDDTGVYSSNNSTDDTRTFPVGSSTKMQAISLSNVKNNKISVRFGDNTIGTAVPNNGLGVWYISPTTQIFTTLTLVNPSGSISNTSNIATYSGTIWKIQPTKFIANNYITSGAITIPNTTTYFVLFTCPTFITNPTSLPDALVGNKYSQILDINLGVSPYSIASYTSSPALYKVTTPVGTQDKIKIAGTAPSSSAQSVTVFFVVKDATGCQTSLSNTITTSIQTIWNGSKWSGVTPDGTTPNVRAVIAGAYSTFKYGNITAGDIIIQPNGILTISSGGTITATDSIKNDGTLIGECGSNTLGTVSGNAAIDRDIPILPLTMPTGFAGQPYSQTFTVEGDASPNFVITNFSPSPSDLKFQNNTLTFTQNTPAILNFTITYNNKNSTCVTTETRQIKILELPSPNLSILNIGSKTYGDDDFKVRTYSRSTGAITYSLLSGTTCAKIDEQTGVITILNAGPSPQNVVVVKASQESKGLYKAETATETFVIKPAAGKFFVLNYAFLVNENKKISVFTKLDPNPSMKFEQLTGTDIAPVAPDGSVTPLKTGTFSVHISMAATTWYTAFDSIYTFNVITQQKPPVAVADTLVLEMGKDSTFNILENDYGMTSEINPSKTDIDTENKGVQTKYYSTELGNFLIDATGNLTILPFYGFIGSGKIGYTVTDANGLSSEIAYIHITVTPPYVTPELQVNDVMTPNGDHMNDALVIANTDLSKENSLIIIDQAGNTVYETINYQNDWEGVDKKNHKLEPGVYFYTFKEKTSGRELKKYIQIVK